MSVAAPCLLTEILTTLRIVVTYSIGYQKKRLGGGPVELARPTMMRTTRTTTTGRQAGNSDMETDSMKITD